MIEKYNSHIYSIINNQLKNIAYIDHKSNGYVLQKNFEGFYVQKQFQMTM